MYPRTNNRFLRHHLNSCPIHRELPRITFCDLSQLALWLKCSLVIDNHPAVGRFDQHINPAFNHLAVVRNLHHRIFRQDTIGLESLIGKFDEMRHITNAHPEIIPYVPLKIAVMQEKDTVVLVSINPETLSLLFPDKDLQDQFGRWESDLRAIFEEVGESKEF